MICRSFRRNRRLLSIAVKLIGLSIVFTFVWLYFSTKTIEISDKIRNQSIKSHSNQSKSLDKTQQKSIEDLRKTIELLNKKQKVLNFDTFGPLEDNDLVLVVQIHNRINYLSNLIQSLERTKGIAETLVVFSHDVFDPLINSLISSIRFCKVIQIFYPHSLQLNPNSFPGQSPNDCPRDVSRVEAQRLGCNNALSPDSYGHYREASICQTKHHWWWKTNRVFDGLNVTAHHSGPVMFLEEDHYLSPDTIHVWKLMNDINRRNDNKYRVITLGSYTRSPDFVRNGDKALDTKWISGQHNMGFIIEKSVWTQIKDCANTFCTFDDYNWDWTLQYVSDHCLSSSLNTLVVSTPRVYHTGGCGLHHKKTKCDNEEVVKKIEKLFDSSHKYLFPKEILVKRSDRHTAKAVKPNGGWADPRDHNLCLNNTSLEFAII